MNTTDLLTIYDRAHGINILGKGAPDGSHREWEWSDNFINKELKPETDKLGFNSIVFPTTSHVSTYKDSKGIDKELLSNRRNYYNSLPYKYKLVLSFHNDASSNQWDTQTGWSMWTTKGDDISDLIAEKYLYPNIFKYHQDLRHRRYFAKQLDNEANFTAITGNYAGILLEWRMQNNKQDIELLKDNTMLVKSIVDFMIAVHRNFEEIKLKWTF